MYLLIKQLVIKWIFLFNYVFNFIKKIETQKYHTDLRFALLIIKKNINKHLQLKLKKNVLFVFQITVFFFCLRYVTISKK